MVEPAFLHAALDYCDVKVGCVDLNRLIRLAPCEWGRDADSDACWVEMDVGNLNLDEACENCQTTYPLLLQRRELARHLPNLAKKMYRLFRLEIGGEDE
jgi:hypothetical protein